MPFQSEKQRRYLHANHPEIAKRWEKEYTGGGRVAYGEGSKEKGIGSILTDFLASIGWEGTAEDLRQEREMGWYLFPELADIFYPEHVYGGDKEKLGRYKKHMKGTHQGSHPQAEAWKKYKKWMEMENYEKANLPKDFATGGISSHFRKKFDVGSEDSYEQLLDDWDAGFIKDALPGEDFTTYYNRIMKVENDTGTEDVEVLNLLAENQDPLNLSEGVTTLFHVKDGGNVRLGPHFIFLDIFIHQYFTFIYVNSRFILFLFS
jgi:hypothetical protein